MMKMQEIMDDFIGPFCFLGGTISLIFFFLMSTVSLMILVIHIVIISTILVYIYIGKLINLMMVKDYMDINISYSKKYSEVL